jgi:OmpA-OmpF porin, OOP family
MSLRKALLAATVLALPMAAQAQPVTGLYVGAGAGLNFRQDADDRGVKVTSEDVGAAVVASIGWGFGNGLRAEVEGNYRDNSVENWTVNGARANGGGYLRTYGAMGNVLYDFNLPGLPVVPYLGVGAGYAWSEIKHGRFNLGASSYRVNEDEGQFAYQGIAGVGYNLGAMVPGLTLTAEYRFLGTLEPTFDITRQAGPARVDVPGSFKPSNYNHSVLLGLRYAFNAPRPAPVAVAAPVPQEPAVARTYLVFFDWDRADLTDRARQIITEAAGASRRVQSTRIEVAGHADRSGTPQYNQRLSERRAQTVAAELVRQGVNRNEIAITAFGESRPLVPTADGVREPQNRRVEIVLR